MKYTDDGRPEAGNGSRQGHEERDIREGRQEFGETLDEHIDRAAVIAGDGAQDAAQKEGQDLPDQADHQGQPPAVDDAREEITPKRIGAHDERW